MEYLNTVLSLGSRMLCPPPPTTQEPGSRAGGEQLCGRRKPALCVQAAHVGKGAAEARKRGIGRCDTHVDQERETPLTQHQHLHHWKPRGLFCFISAVAFQKTSLPVSSSSSSSKHRPIKELQA